MTHQETARQPKPLGEADTRGGIQILRYSTVLFATGFLVHNGDHLRRGTGALTPQVMWAGTVASVLAVAAIAMVFAGHRLAPLVAVAVGFPTALGVAATHLLPHWSAFSDAFPGGSVDALSWGAVLFEIAGALALGAAGVYVLRLRRGDRDRHALSR